MAIKIVDVEIMPQTLNVGQILNIKISIQENNWDNVKGSFSNWQQVKDNLLSWTDLKNI